MRVICHNPVTSHCLHFLIPLPWGLGFQHEIGVVLAGVAQMVKYLPAMWKTRVWSLGLEDPLEKEMATHSCTLAWKIPWTEEPCRLQSMGSQRVGHDWATSLHFFTLTAPLGRLYMCYLKLLQSLQLWGSLNQRVGGWTSTLPLLLQMDNSEKIHKQTSNAAMFFRGSWLWNTLPKSLKAGPG